MVKLDVVHQFNTNLANSQPLVAVLAGATAGIGEATVRSLAEAHGTHGKGLRVYFVGRNSKAAQQIIADCKGICPNGEFIFVRASDLALLKEVDRVCEGILKAEQTVANDGKAKIDLLVLSQGMLSFDPRKDTPEGLDEIMSLSYYSRMRFIIQLLPLLLESTIGHVVSVFNPKLEGKVILDDLSLREPKNFAFKIGASHLVHLHTFFFENLAQRHARKLSLIHLFPGLVLTNAAYNGNLPTWMKMLWRYVVAPLSGWRAVPKAECGARILFLTSPKYPARSMNAGGDAHTVDDLEVATSSDGIVGGGAYRIDLDGETIATGEAYETAKAAGMYDLVYEHTMKAFKEIEAGRAFKD
ncbi:hypothetical protein BT63DRAFT_425902 [Microthyrium microscopicum]|uniref:NAD(P)-binding protein n=1 Tax=Microthyrium microscopicum TaxID=703497 RepID=A0A6A6UBA2_9PEZI|nr:hypothetical protein BT63DRAFT_425902 [Microthyrium microscopicum]